MAHRQTPTVLARTRQMLANATLGLADLTGPDPQRHVAGLHNVTVWGRAVTNVLQGLRTVYGDDFDSWYAPWVAEMRGDPLLRYFYKWRTETLKEGGPHTTSGVHLKSFSSAILPAPPPGAHSFFIGDEHGGSGWVVKLPDGTKEKHYVTLPIESVAVRLLIPDPPGEHLGKPIAEQTAEHLCELYVAYLSRLVSEAESHFSSLPIASISAGEAPPQVKAISESDIPSGNSSRRRRRRRRRA